MKNKFLYQLLATGAACLALNACKPSEVDKTQTATASTATPAATSAPVAAPSVAETSSAAPSAPAEKAATPVVAAAPAALAASGEKLYTVVDGTKVDAKTMEGFRTWRAAACDRCHGANQEGMVGPSLIASLKVLSKDEFVKTLKEGRLEKGMPSWTANEQVMSNMDNLYAYLKGRSDGAITQARVSLAP